MMTLIALVVIFACGFFIGSAVGYNKAREDITRIIERVEKVQRR